jgi:hypothetical protein
MVFDNNYVLSARKQGYRGPDELVFKMRAAPPKNMFTPPPNCGLSFSFFKHPQNRFTISDILPSAGRATQIWNNKFFPTLANPAMLPGRIAVNQGMGRNIFSDYRARPHKGVFAHGHAADNSAVGAQAGAFAYQCGPRLVHTPDIGPGVEHGGENHAGAAENIVFQGYAFVNTYVILNFTAIANNHIRPGNHILADIAVFPNNSTRHYMAEMPNPAIGANFYIAVNNSADVNKIIFSHYSPLQTPQFHAGLNEILKIPASFNVHYQ